MPAVKIPIMSKSDEEAKLRLEMTEKYQLNDLSGNLGFFPFLSVSSFAFLFSIIWGFYKQHRKPK